MKTIHKQTLQIVDSQTLMVPTRAEFLSVQMQRGVPCIWYKCDDTRGMEPREIAISGTGHDMSHCDGFRFLGTIQLHEGQIVFHVFVEF